MTVLKQKLMKCETCEKKTKHERNEEKFNWLLHLFLTLFTGGIWAFVLVLYAIITPQKNNEPWTCSVCGNEREISKWTGKPK